MYKKKTRIKMQKILQQREATTTKKATNNTKTKELLFTNGTVYRTLTLYRYFMHYTPKCLGSGNIKYTSSAQASYSLVFSENRNFMFWTSIFYEHFHFNCSMLWTRTACSLWTVLNDMANAHMHTVTRTCQLSPRRLAYLLIQEIEYGICIKWHKIIFRLFFFYLSSHWTPIYPVYMEH